MTRHDCDPSHSTSFELPSTGSSTTPSATSNCSASLVNPINVLWISQSECGFMGQIPVSDCTTPFSSCHLTSSSTSSTVRMETLPQSCNPPICSGATMPHYLPRYSSPGLPGRISPTTSNYPYCCSYLHSQTPFNMLDISTSTSLTEPIVDALDFPASRVAGSNNDAGANESSVTGNGANFSSVPDEVNREERRIWQCPDCKKTYDSSASLRMHLQSHSRSWKCHFCDKAFSRKWILVAHERRHTGERPVVCPVCQRTFPDRSIMRKHIQAHRAAKHCHYTRCSWLFASCSQIIGQMGWCQPSALVAIFVDDDALVS
ncbi:unnamed protein product [Taenia asiatica]|uniref:Zinc finger, C2H2 type n=1 Tax=Taenia asiatica TaxID=60517 RepID=A0A0R3WGL1_TAEAS|nr:unnamed protein product [Taenia asiatica]